MAIHIPVDIDPIEFVIPNANNEKVTFGVVPFDYLSRDVLGKYKTWLKKNSRLATEDEANLKMLELILDETTYNLVASYPPAVARQIVEKMAEKSEVTVGESSASTS